MFTISIDRMAKIAGCPSGGLAALDFRRSHGLPDGTDNRVRLQLEFTDEEIIRSISRFGFVDTQCNLLWHNGIFSRCEPFRPHQEQPYYFPYYTDGTVAFDPALLARVIAGDHQAVAELCSAYYQERTTAKTQWAADRAAYQEKVKQQQEEREEAQRQLTKARELLAAELQQGETAAANLRILGNFLSSVPQDALRGTLKSLTAGAGHDALEALQKSVEDASPYYRIFEKE